MSESPMAPTMAEIDAVPLAMYVVYDHPLDHPEHIVIRRWNLVSGVATPDDERMSLHDTIEEAHDVLENFLHRYNVGRTEQDDPVIVSVWL